MPPIIAQIISIISLVAQAGPEIAKVYENARKLFATLFAGGIITAEQQEKLMTWADEHEADTLAGKIHPALQVEPDPETPAPPTDPV